MEYKTEIKPDSKAKTNCLNNYNSYLLCRSLARELYWEFSTCKELEKNLIENCANSSFIDKCLFNQIKLEK